MKVFILIENTGNENEYIIEHGLSVLIEINGKKILLDGGSSDSFTVNAKRMGHNLNDIDYCVLSHGHYDHSTGLVKFLEINKTADIYASKYFDGRYYSGSGDSIHYIGVPDELSQNENRIKRIDKIEQIDKGIYLIPHTTQGLEKIGLSKKLYKRVENNGEYKYIPDDFCHEQSLVIEENEELVIFNSCSHGGVENIFKEVKEALPNKKIKAFVGGLHMKGQKNGIEICTFSDEELIHFSEIIKSENPDALYIGHCTGIPAYEKLKNLLKDKIIKIETGMQFTL